MNGRNGHRKNRKHSTALELTNSYGFTPMKH